MEKFEIPARERQALQEVGRTTVSRQTAAVLTLVFLVTIGVAAVLQTVTGPSPAAAFGDLGRAVSQARRTAAVEGWLAGNRSVLAALDTFETRLDDESVLRARLLPPVQLALSGLLGAGNEQAYLGRGTWLFYRPDVDYVTRPGFLEPDVIERRRRGGEAWEAPPVPDPVPAIVALARDLAARDIELLVMPTPVKPMIHPGALVWRRTPDPPLRNPSWNEFVERLGSEGVEVLDAAAWMAALASPEEALFLVADTHWTPRAMEQVARRLAEAIAMRLPPATAPAMPLLRGSRSIQGRGDISAMLRLPDDQRLFPPQTVSVSAVTPADGSVWQSDPGAEVLLLGDSFTNVFSEAALGWGSGAGLAEQLSFFLARSVDRIALNAGGSNASRRALLDALVGDPDRLSTTKIVVYQFAMRELAVGDWPLLPLPPSDVE